MAFLADALKRIKPSATIAITDKARELKAAGRDVIGLGAGEPDFDTPDNIKQAAIARHPSAARPSTPMSTASPSSRRPSSQVQARERARLQAVADHRRHRRQAGALQRASCATLNPGDEVVIPAPYWVSYPDIVLLAGGKPVAVVDRAWRTASR